MEPTEKHDEEEGHALKKKGNRRAFLTGAAGAAVGATAATLLPQRAGRAQAASGDPLIVGQHNTASDGEWTALVGNNGPREGILAVVNTFGPDTSSLVGDAPNGGTAVRAMTANGPGVHATSEDGPGVVGESGSPRFGFPGFVLGAGSGVEGRSGTGPGVQGNSQSGPGVRGHSGSAIGIHGDSESGPGVVGATHAPGHGFGHVGVAGVSFKPGAPVGPAIPDHLGEALGVSGESGAGIGVLGISLTGIGLLGRAPGEAPAVRAVSTDHYGSLTPDGGLALDVLGKARFSTAGSAVVPARARTATVENPAVTEHSHVTVTFTGDPGGGSVDWVEHQPGSGFVLHLRGSAAPREVPFTYLIVEPAE